MDTITQMTLGAAVGEAVLGKKVGNKAILWGAAAGIIPDLDVAIGVFMEPVQRLVFHRGFSHSILFAVLFAPVLGYIISKIHRKEAVGWKDWTLLSFLSIVTHPLLDSFTTYGTQLFYPFSKYPVAFNTIYVIDPLYTLPFLACVIAVLFLKRASSKRRIVNWLGIGLSTAYLSLTVVNKLHVDSVVASSLEQQNIEFDYFMTTPAPLTTILWRAVVISGNRAFSGYYSLLDSKKEIAFSSLPRNSDLLEGMENHWEISELIRFSKGFYGVSRDGEGVIFNDLRYGKTGIDPSEEDDYIFSFKIRPAQEYSERSLRITRIRPELKVDRETLHRLLQRIRGI